MNSSLPDRQDDGAMPSLHHLTGRDPHFRVDRRDSVSGAEGLLACPKIFLKPFLGFVRRSRRSSSTPSLGGSPIGFLAYQNLPDGPRRGSSRTTVRAVAASGRYVGPICGSPRLDTVSGLLPPCVVLEVDRQRHRGSRRSLSGTSGSEGLRCFRFKAHPDGEFPLGPTLPTAPDVSIHW